jgi:hypothetical protein
VNGGGGRTAPDPAHLTTNELYGAPDPAHFTTSEPSGSPDPAHLTTNEPYGAPDPAHLHFPDLNSSNFKPTMNS